MPPCTDHVSRFIAKAWVTNYFYATGLTGFHRHFDHHYGGSHWPLAPQFPHPQQAWLTLAMATTLAGNLTLLGSVANLIVAEIARQRGGHLSFMAYLKAGLPITCLTLLVGASWLQIIL